MAADVVFGLNTLDKLISHKPHLIRSIFFDAGSTNKRLSALLTKARAQGVSLERCKSDKLGKITGGGNHQGIVAQVGQMQWLDEAGLLAHIEPIENPFVMFCDGVTDPHNLGAILRNAQSFGVDAVVLAKNNSSPINAVVHKVSSGASFTQDVAFVTNLSRTIRELKALGIWVYGLALEEGASAIQTVSLVGSIGLVLGSEGAGLREGVKKCCDGLIQIPMSGDIESLNVSCASAISAYEVARQRALAR